MDTHLFRIWKATQVDPDDHHLYPRAVAQFRKLLESSRAAAAIELREWMDAHKDIIDSVIDEKLEVVDRETSFPWKIFYR